MEVSPTPDDQDVCVCVCVSHRNVCLTLDLLSDLDRVSERGIVFAHLHPDSGLTESEMLDRLREVGTKVCIVISLVAPEGECTIMENHESLP